MQSIPSQISPTFHSFISPPNLFLNSILDSGQKRLWVRTDNLTSFLAILEDQESGHSADTEFLGDVGDFVDVELDEVCAGEFLREPESRLLVFAPER